VNSYSVEVKPPAKKELEALPDSLLARVVRRIMRRRRYLRLFHQFAYGRLEFGTLFERVAQTIRKLGQDNSNVRCRCKAFLVSLRMNTITQRRMQERQRVMTVQ
jgi:hypothetical protein